MLWECLEEMGVSKDFIENMKSLYVDVRCSVKTPCGETRDISSRTGLKQGCVLSPILFALYVKDLGNKLMSSGKGIEMNGVKIPGLFFADDMVLIGKDKEELKVLLSILGDWLSRRKLSINCGKSKVWRQGNGILDEVWDIRNWKGESMGQLKEVKEYKYLGVLISSEPKNIFKKHGEKKSKKARAMVGAIKCKARDSWSSAEVADKLWNVMACPGLLYAMEVIKWEEKVIDKLEVCQFDMARWITGARKFCARVALLAELGWETIRMKIWKAKLKYYGRICFMEEERWVKCTIIDSAKEGWKCGWVKEMEFIREKLGGVNLVGVKNFVEWKKKCVKKINDESEEKWRKDRMSMSSMLHYKEQYKAGSRRKAYIDGSEEAKEFFRVKTGCAVLKRGSQGYTQCRICNVPDNEIHRILYCVGGARSRQECGLSEIIGQERSEGLSDVEIMGKLSVGDKRECLKKGSWYMMMKDEREEICKNLEAVIE